MILNEIMRRLADLERRMNNVVRPGRIAQVDAKNGMVKVAYALDDKDQDVISPWIRWGEQRAGDISTWYPPTVGEQVYLFSPSGEIGMLSIVGPSVFSQQFPQKHDKEGEAKTQVEKDNKKSFQLMANNFQTTDIDGEKNINAKKVTHTKRTA